MTARLAPVLVLGGGVALVLVGIALFSIPAALIAGGAALLGAATFDPSKARKLTWPR